MWTRETRDERQNCRGEMTGGVTGTPGTRGMHSTIAAREGWPCTGESVAVTEVDFVVDLPHHRKDEETPTNAVSKDNSDNSGAAKESAT